MIFSSMTDASINLHWRAGLEGSLQCVHSSIDAIMVWRVSYKHGNRMAVALIGAIAVLNILLGRHAQIVDSKSIMMMGAPPVHTSTITETNAKPRMILHVGPPKTATSTLQQQLTLTYQPLLNDFIYLGNRAGLPIPPTRLQTLLLDVNCQVQLDFNQNNVPSCWHEVIKELDRYRGKNVILSHEDWGTDGSVMEKDRLNGSHSSKQYRIGMLPL